MVPLIKQKSSYVYLAGSVIFIIVALIVGIDDNVPGIILLFISSILLVLAFTHNWNRPKPYVLLIIFSLVGFVVSTILHNVFEAIGGERTFFGIVGALFFLVALFLCPAGLLMGIIGSIIKSFNKTKIIQN